MQARTYQFNNSTVTVNFGSILQSEAEVIVSSDDCRLTMGGGISRQIELAAGSGFADEAHKHTPAPLGSVVLTGGGRLKQKYVMHAITIDRNALRECDTEKKLQEVQEYIITHSIEQCLRLVGDLGLHSIAFPAIGAGVARIPYPQVAKSMAEAFSTILTATNKKIAVELWLFDRYGAMTQMDFLPFFEHLAMAGRMAMMKRPSADEEDKPIAPDADIRQGKADELAHDVFISYSRKDLELVRPVCGLLNEMGVPYWIDVDGTYSGENYKGVIVNAIKAAQVVLFLSSANSNGSKNVAKEVCLADRYGKVIIPVRLDNAPYAPDIDYDLSGIDAIDFGTSPSAALEKIRRVVQARLAIGRTCLEH